MTDNLKIETEIDKQTNEKIPMIKKPTYKPLSGLEFDQMKRALITYNNRQQLKYSDIVKFGAMIGVRNFSIWKSQMSHTRDERTYHLVWQALFNRGYDMTKLDL